jgi:hypothetical protein
MRHGARIIRMARKPHWPVLLLAFALAPTAASAQAGTAGGTVGVQDKSVSGGQDREVRSQPSRKAARRESTERQGSAERRAGVDGSWPVSATGRCIPSWNLTFLISNGTISGSGATGHVLSSGAASGNVVVLGLRFDFIGHFRARQASGTFTGADGCPGTWTASKD